MNGKDKDNGRDREGLWDYVTRTIRPLRRDRGPAVTAAGTAPPSPAPERKEAAERAPPSGGVKIPAAHPGDGLDRRTDRKLKQGRMAVEARLDLHGHSRERAYAALQDFIVREAGRGTRCVLVITGKGRGEEPGLLRRAVPEWLAGPPLGPLVLRFYPAQPRDGGAGALYVLLRRQR